MKNTFKQLKEIISKEDIEELYINQNLPLKVVSEKLNISGKILHKLKDYYNIYKSPEQVLECRRHTNLERYGKECYFQTSNCIEKSKQTKIERFGSLEESYRQAIEKNKQTRLEKYGDENYNNPEKALETKVERYGSIENFYAKREEKTKKTCLEKFGVDNAYKSEEVKLKIKDTLNERYGVDYSSHIPEVQTKKKKKFMYKGISFDSSWELIYYIYCLDHNISISRNTDKWFDYFYKDERHRYFPDFIVDDKIIEIKGNHLLDEDNNLTSFYSDVDKSLSDKEKQYCKELSLAKSRCMKDNNVILISDISIYKKYIDDKYGKNYIRQFKRY